MRARTTALNSPSAEARSLHACTIHSAADAIKAMMPKMNTTG